MSTLPTIQLSESERETIRLAGEFDTLRRNPAWLQLRAKMQELVDEAATARDDARYAHDSVIAAFQRVYQARLDFVQSIDQYVTSIADAKRATMQDIATSLGYTQGQAEAAFQQD